MSVWSVAAYFAHDPHILPISFEFAKRPGPKKIIGVLLSLAVLDDETIWPVVKIISYYSEKNIRVYVTKYATDLRFQR